MKKKQPEVFHCQSQEVELKYKRRVQYELNVSLRTHRKDNGLNEYGVIAGGWVVSI